MFIISRITTRLPRGVAACRVLACLAEEGAKQLRRPKHQDPVVVRAWSAVCGCLGKGVFFTALLVPANKAINLKR